DFDSRSRYSKWSPPRPSEKDGRPKVKTPRERPLFGRSYNIFHSPKRSPNPTFAETGRFPFPIVRIVPRPLGPSALTSQNFSPKVYLIWTHGPKFFWKKS